MYQMNNEYRRKSFKRDPNRIQARNFIALALKAGVVKRPLRCEGCRRKTQLHGHHYLGYSPKNWLKVKWLCPACHSQEHRR